MKRMRWIVLIPIILAGIALFVVLGGLVVQWLWNWLLPALFGVPRVTFWQALGLLALCRILFGGFRSHGGASSRARRRIKERLSHLTPEERERMRLRIHHRFGGGPPADARP